MARELSKKGFNVQICALHPNFSSLRNCHIEREGVKISYVGQMHVYKQGSNKKYFSDIRLIIIGIKAIFAFIRMCMTTPIDILYVCKPHPMNVLAAIGCRLIRRFILLLDYDDDETHSNRFLRLWQKRTVNYFETNFPKRVNFCTTNTISNMRRLIRNGLNADRILFLPNGVDEARFLCPSSGEIAKIRTELGWKDNPIVLYVGSLSRISHPVDILIKTMKRVVNKLPEVRLLIIGGGEDIDYFKQLAYRMDILDISSFLGKISPDKVVNYYYACNVSVEPVHFDDVAQGRSPLKMFESWFCGIPFITGNVGDRKIISGEPPAALLVTPGDECSYAEAIIKVLTDKNFSDQLVEEGRRRVAFYTWENLMDQVEREIIRLMALKTTDRI